MPDIQHFFFLSHYLGAIYQTFYFKCHLCIFKESHFFLIQFFKLFLNLFKVANQFYEKKKKHLQLNAYLIIYSLTVPSITFQGCTRRHQKSILTNIQGGRLIYLPSNSIHIYNPYAFNYQNQRFKAKTS